MPIGKHEFYEGAALHQLLRSDDFQSLVYDAPFFVVNGSASIHLKHCTKIRGPWQFTFGPHEQQVLESRGVACRLFLGLVCGADGIAAISYGQFAQIAPPSAASVAVACRRRYNEHYAISGPAGELSRKVPPSLWQRIPGPNAWSAT